MRRFEGKTIVITGAASGIGAASSRRFADEGARVAMLDVKADMGEALARDIGTSAHFIACNVADGDALVAAIDLAAERMGGIDILFNNAGAGALGNVADLDIAAWRRIMATNLDACFIGCKTAIPHMRKRGGGVIINTASVLGLFGDNVSSAYTASKGAVINLTRSMAIDFALENIRVNAICPGFIETGIFGTDIELLRPGFEAQIPMRRGALPEEVAGVAAFLASDDASYITGTTITVDGGMTARTGTPDYRETTPHRFS